MKVYKPYGKKPLVGVKGIDFALLPPCHSVLMQQIKRANLICSIWNNATKMNPRVFPPNENGWVLENSKYTLNWFEGEMTPPTLQDMVVEEEDLIAEGDDEDLLNECESDVMEEDIMSDED
ncbi:Uncharacterized protein APZ42_026172 [Daphnia magna]|uniref:Uncharacterized protein n=1 Tax=Daphnia magna TaxID=35525 RepID=A0A162DBK1_9CRUS|nr:Uncharacterized protein APZ42_026172 [Daphnia magna]